jgi:hypothetical protein
MDKSLVDSIDDLKLADEFSFVKTITVEQSPPLNQKSHE